VSRKLRTALGILNDLHPFILKETEMILKETEMILKETEIILKETEIILKDPENTVNVVTFSMVYVNFKTTFS
jgi:hypothetical protein